MTSWIFQFLSKVRGLIGQSKADFEFESEMQTHLEQLVQKFVSQGMRQEDAILAARRQFGNTTLLHQRQRETRSFFALSALLQDVGYGLRMLARSPGFTTTAVLTLALGIGANAAIFTLLNAVLLRTLPVTDPKMLLRLGDSNDCCENAGAPDGDDYALFSTDAYRLLKKSAPEFEELAAMEAGFGFRPIIARREGGREGARSVMGEFVSGNYFRTFGLQPQAGRLISDADDVVGAPMAAVMSYEAWKQDYAGDASIIGSTFWVNTKPVTITGIAPEGFYGDRLSSAPPDFYLPIETMPVLTNADFVHDPDQIWLYLIGRVKPGVSLLPLQQKLSTLLRQALAPTRNFSWLPRGTFPESKAEINSRRRTSCSRQAAQASRTCRNDMHRT
jgi:macrolide transport system ATP-binding/permease protein